MIFKLIQQGVLAILVVGACAFAWSSFTPVASGPAYEARQDSIRSGSVRHDHHHSGRGGWVPAHADRQARLPADTSGLKWD